MWPGTESNADTEIFSLLLLSRVCVAIGRQLNEYKSLTQP
jgi:hypothetical protein